MFFPTDQHNRRVKRWILGFVPAFLIVLSSPVFMMGGIFRPVLTAGMLRTCCGGVTGPDGGWEPS